MTVTRRYGFVDFGAELRWVQRELYLLGHTAKAKRDFASKIVCRCERPVFDTRQRWCLKCGHPWTAQHVESGEPKTNLFWRGPTLGDPEAVWPADKEEVLVVCVRTLRDDLLLRRLNSEAKRLDAARWWHRRLSRDERPPEACELAVAA